MRIISEHANVTMAGPGSWGFDAEVEVQDIEGNMPNTYFVYAGEYDGMPAFSVSTKSIYAYLAGISEDEPAKEEILEEYETIEEAQESRFARYFIIAKRMLDDILENV